MVFPMSEHQALQIHRQDDRCPYCHDGVGSELPRLACNTCAAWHHQACWEEAGGRCSACGESLTGVQERPPEPRQAPRPQPPVPVPTGFWYYVGLPLDLVMAYPRLVALGIVVLLALGGALSALVSK